MQLLVKSNKESLVYPLTAQISSKDQIILINISQFTNSQCIIPIHFETIDKIKIYYKGKADFAQLNNQIQIFELQLTIKLENFTQQQYTMCSRQKAINFSLNHIAPPVKPAQSPLRTQTKVDDPVQPIIIQPEPKVEAQPEQPNVQQGQTDPAQNPEQIVQPDQPLESNSKENLPSEHSKNELNNSLLSTKSMFSDIENVFENLNLRDPLPLPNTFHFVFSQSTPNYTILFIFQDSEVYFELLNISLELTIGIYVNNVVIPVLEWPGTKTVLSAQMHQFIQLLLALRAEQNAFEPFEFFNLDSEKVNNIIKGTKLDLERIGGVEVIAEYKIIQQCSQLKYGAIDNQIIDESRFGQICNKIKLDKSVFCVHSNKLNYNDQITDEEDVEIIKFSNTGQTVLLNSEIPVDINTECNVGKNFTVVVCKQALNTSFDDKIPFVYKQKELFIKIMGAFTPLKPFFTEIQVKRNAKSVLKKENKSYYKIIVKQPKQILKRIEEMHCSQLNASVDYQKQIESVADQITKIMRDNLNKEILTENDIWKQLNGLFK
ncbi:Hypothetical_protein [Hexamita inflata]|uniref:Hypothetical_protein n=1 Tax=Hexamita inflata TaxID=28002 RepID=A0AA86UFE7_9EUKA|nr:Hypothetical protein HINF_LOCUS43665 [Hexamita inflata]